MNKRIALLSVKFKTPTVLNFARKLVALGFDIVASAGTVAALAKIGIAAQDVAVFVGGGPIMDHLVATLSRELHAGLLARLQKHLDELEVLGFPRVDLVCVGFYPVWDAIKKPDANLESVIEDTDIGGPALVSSGDKGRRIVICDPEADCDWIADWLEDGEPDREEVLTSLMAKGDNMVSWYRSLTATFHSKGHYRAFFGEKLWDCLYGENPWQQPAAVYQNFQGLDVVDDPLAIKHFQLVAGTTPSYNNSLDLDRALQTITHIAAAFEVNRGEVPYIAVAVKHGNACGAAFGDDPITVIKRTVAGDPLAIFGGMVIMNFTFDENVAEILMTYKMPKGQRRILDGIFVPCYFPRTLETIKRKGDKCRLFVNPALFDISAASLDQSLRFHPIRGGFQVQPNYTFVIDLNASMLQKHGRLSKINEDNLLLAWAIGSTSNSNTITLVRDQMLIGNAVGQQKRVDACKLAFDRARSAGHSTEGSMAYSDSFFPFTDGPEELVKAGIKGVLTSSGSIHDPEVIAYCKENKIITYLIPDAVGRGFFGH